MATPIVGSILLGSHDPRRLRDWYRAAFGCDPSGDGFIQFRGVALLTDGRADTAAGNPEPGRVILKFHGHDARGAAAHRDRVGVHWLVPVGAREDGQFKRRSTRTATSSGPYN